MSAGNELAFKLERLRQLERLEAAVLATAEHQPVEVLELCQLPESDPALAADLLYLAHHRGYLGISTSLVLVDADALVTTLSGRLAVVVRDAAAFLRWREAGR